MINSKFSGLSIGAVLACAALGCGIGELQPPKNFNTALQPGALIEFYTKPAKIEFVCYQQQSIGQVTIVKANPGGGKTDAATGAPFVDPGTGAAAPANGPAPIIESPEPDFSSSSSSQAQASLDAGISGALTFLQAKGSFKHLKKITYNATNVKRYTASLASIFGGKQETGCKNALKDRVDQGYRVDVVTQSFVGDIVYSIEYQNDVSAQVKIEISKDLAPSLGGSYNDSDSTKIEGKSVTWLAASTPYGSRGRRGD